MTSNIFKHKWLILIVFCVIIVVFDALAVNVSIVNRGIVIGMAIDVEGEELMVTAQVALPKNSAVSTGGNNYLNITAQSKTFQGAIDKLSQELGSSMSLAHTIVMVFGKAVFDSGHGDIVEKLIIKDAFHDSMLLCMAEDKGKDTLSAKVPFGDTASFQLQRLIKPIRPALGQTGLSIKQYIVDYYDRNTACYLPIVHVEKGEPSSDQGKDGEESADVLRINGSAIIGTKGLICELTGEANDGFSIIKRKLTGGVLPVEGRDGEKLGIKIIGTNVDASYDLAQKKVHYKINAKVIRETGSHDERNMVSFKLTDGERASCIEVIQQLVNAAFDTLKDNNTDALLLYENFYQRYGSAWAQSVSNDYMQDITCEVTVNLSER